MKNLLFTFLILLGLSIPGYSQVTSASDRTGACVVANVVVYNSTNGNYFQCGATTANVWGAITASKANAILGIGASGGATIGYTTSQTMALADCPISLKTFTGSSALTYTLILPSVAIGTNGSCSISLQNNTTQAFTLNVITNSTSINGSSLNGSIPACVNPQNGCKAASIKYNTTTLGWDVTSPALDVTIGAFLVAAGSSSVVVNNPAVTANSQIIVSSDSSLGAKLSATCNSTIPALFGVSSRAPGASFTFSSTVPITLPACFGYVLVNQ